MAKVVNDARKLTFGRRKGGKPFKSKGPKAKSVSKYKGQGRQIIINLISVTFLVTLFITKMYIFL